MNIVTILSTSLIHFSLKGWENVLFELGSERVKGLKRKDGKTAAVVRFFDNSGCFGRKTGNSPRLTSRRVGIDSDL